MSGVTPCSSPMPNHNSDTIWQSPSYPSPLTQLMHEGSRYARTRAPRNKYTPPSFLTPPTLPAPVPSNQDLTSPKDWFSAHKITYPAINPNRPEEQLLITVEIKRRVFSLENPPQQTSEEVRAPLDAEQTAMTAKTQTVLKIEENPPVTMTVTPPPPDGKQDTSPVDD